MLRTFLETGSPPLSAEDLLSRVWLSLTSLLSAHGFQPAKPWGGGDVRLSANMEGSDTYECLRTQVRWYTSRKELHTLLAWKDRFLTGASPTALSPFMTYLRFHAGDAIFVGILLRVVSRFDYLLKAWRANQATWGTTFLDAVSPSGWDAGDVADLRDGLRNHWATARVRPETAWHNIGAIDALRQLPNPPSWMRSPEPPDPRLTECARIVVRLVEELHRPGVLDAVSVALEHTPAFWLANHGFTAASGAAGADVLVKSHSFERLRLAYAQAARDAGIE